jgi:hypothetical protein
MIVNELRAPARLAALLSCTTFGATVHLLYARAGWGGAFLVRFHDDLLRAVAVSVEQRLADPWSLAML